MFKAVGLIGKYNDARVAQTLGELARYLGERAVEVLLDADSATRMPDLGVPLANRERLGEQCDLVIIVGGDGTFLHAARSLSDSDVRLLGINLGRLGFLTDVMPAEITVRLDEIFSGEFSEEARTMLDARIERGGDTVVSERALNDVVAHKLNIARLIEFETYIDGRLVNSQRSDGLIVSTPTGSTAYALSGGGPIIYPTLGAVVLVPICPHTLSNRPIVVHDHSAIELVMRAGAEAQVTCDGQSAVPLQPDDRIVIRKCARELRLIHPRGHDYFATLRAKLHWAKGT